MQKLNIAKLFFDHAKTNPNKIAFVIPKNIKDPNTFYEEIITFGEFKDRVIEFQAGLEKNSFKKGDRLIILAPINENTYALMLAMFSLGMIAVFLDPGIGFKKILTAISDSKSCAIVSIDRVLKYHLFIPQLWRMKKYSMDKKRFFVQSFEKLISKGATKEKIIDLSPSDHALITFTSGSTGRSKGSDRNVFNIKEQISFIQKSWNCDSDSIDFPSFPMFGFMNLTLGITTIVPALDFAKISDFNPEIVASQMRKWKITRMCGSFAFNDKIASYLISKKIEISTLKDLALGGCPVNKEFCEKLKLAYPNANSKIIYGSTEVAPISHLSIEEYLHSQNQSGFPVGRPYEGVEVSVVNLPKRLFEFDEREQLPYELEYFKIGEIIIRSAHTVQRYVDNDKATRENKIKSPSGLNWHKTGDTGYKTHNGSIYLVGRTSDTIKVQGVSVHPFMVETLLDDLEEVRRSALVQIKKRAVLFVQKNDNFSTDDITRVIKERLPVELRDSALIKYIEEIPVDDRHKSKINRVILRGIQV